MRHVVVVAGAPWRWSEDAVRLVRGADALVAADAGANHLARIGVRPDAVIGDLDSVAPGVRAWVGEERLIRRFDQDWTDLHKALAFAFDELGAEKVTVLAAGAGRLDHLVENLALLVRWRRRGELELREADVVVVPVLDHARFDTALGQQVSLLPLGSCRVWTAGLAWPLAGEVLDLLVRTGVSNRATGAEVELRVEGGGLLVVLHTLPSAPGTR